MRTRLSWVILLSLIAFLNLGCGSLGNDDDDSDNIFSDPFIERVLVGNVPVQAQETANVSLDNSYSMQFELSKPVSLTSLSQSFNFEIWVQNMTTGQAFLLTPCVLEANGALAWVGTSNQVIEYRSVNNLSLINTGGFAQPIGFPGDRFKIKVLFLIARAEDGTNISVMDDTFYIVWSS